MTATLRAEGVMAWYEDVPAVSDVDLEVAGGAITAIIGPTDSGKSTLVRMFNRLAEESPAFRSQGRILLDDVDVSTLSTDALRRRVGMLLSRPAVFPMDIFHNVVFGLNLAGRDAWRERGDRAESALRAVQLWDVLRDRLDESPDSLSTGEQQRLCLARALALKPEVMLFDGPTDHLDPVEAGRLETVVYGLRETCTVLLVTQDTRLAGRIADVTAFMDGGRLIEVGPTEELFTRPRHQATEAYLNRRS